VLIGILLFITGLVFGSFLNVLIYRIPRGESVVWPGSHCPACGHELKAWDLVPVASYIWLKGRCRYCKGKISICYPIVELLTAVTFLLVYLRWGLSIELGVGWVFTALLIVAAVTDINGGIIPDKLTYPGIIMGILFSFFTIGIKSSILGMLIFSGLFLITAIISGGGMGGGDIKLAAVIGAFTGPIGILMVFIISSLLGGLWAVVLLVEGNADRKTAIKFGPFLSGAAWMVWMYGNRILECYWQLFI